MACIRQISGAILFESTLSMLGLGASNATSLGSMLYWAIQWGSIRTGAWWAFVPPTFMLTLIVFSLLLLQSSLNEVFNPRLRRGRAARKRAKDEGEELEVVPVEGEDAGPANDSEAPFTQRPECRICAKQNKDNKRFKQQRLGRESGENENP